MPNYAVCLANEYIAGFFDGEGCVRISKKSSCYYLHASINQVKKPVLESLQNRFGGSVYLNPKRGNQRDIWAWVIQNRQAIKFLQEILPYLIGKKEEVELALEFTTLPKLSRWRARTEEETNIRENYKQQLSILKRAK